MQGFACLLQPNSELLSDNRELWVISHHASSGTAGSQEPHHISSLSDLGGKLPSLNSDVQERERGSQKKKRANPWETMGEKNGRQTFIWKEPDENKDEGWHRLVTVNVKKKFNVCVFFLKTMLIKDNWNSRSWNCPIYNMISLWWKQSRPFSVFLSCFVLSLSALLISKRQWLHWIEQWLCIDLGCPLRTNVISACATWVAGDEGWD